MADNHYTQTRDLIEDSFRYLEKTVNENEDMLDNDKQKAFDEIAKLKQFADDAFTLTYRRAKQFIDGI